MCVEKEVGAPETGINAAGQSASSFGMPRVAGVSGGSVCVCVMRSRGRGLGVEQKAVA